MEDDLLMAEISDEKTTLPSDIIDDDMAEDGRPPGGKERTGQRKNLQNPHRERIV